MIASLASVLSCRTLEALPTGLPGIGTTAWWTRSINPLRPVTHHWLQHNTCADQASAPLPDGPDPLIHWDLLPIPDFSTTAWWTRSIKPLRPVTHHWLQHHCLMDQIHSSTETCYPSLASAPLPDGPDPLNHWDLLPITDFSTTAWWTRSINPLRPVTHHWLQHHCLMDQIH